MSHKRAAVLAPTWRRWVAVQCPPGERMMTEAAVRKLSGTGHVGLEEE